MKQSIELLRSKTDQTGSALVTILVIAIIVVLILLWQAGAFSGSESATSAGTAGGLELTPDTTEEATGGPATNDTPRAATKQSQLKTTPLEPMVQKPTGKEPQAIAAMAETLLAAHPVDLAPCQAETDPNKALECASGIQATVLEAVFKDYEARRAAGDLVINARGSEVLKLVVADMNARLKSFEDAAK